MAMKKTDLEKNKALKLTHSMKQAHSREHGSSIENIYLASRANLWVEFQCSLRPISRFKGCPPQMERRR